MCETHARCSERLRGRRLLTLCRRRLTLCRRRLTLCRRVRLRRLGIGNSCRRLLLQYEPVSMLFQPRVKRRLGYASAPQQDERGRFSLELEHGALYPNTTAAVLIGGEDEEALNPAEIRHHMLRPRRAHVPKTVR